MASRDVQINLIGNDRTGRATRSAAANLDRLAAKVDKFNSKNAKLNVDTSATKKLEQSFGKAGDAAGKSFASRFQARLAAATQRVRVRVNTNNLRAAGLSAGRVFSNAVGSAISDGSRAIGNAVRRVMLATIRVSGPVAVYLGLQLAGFIGQGLTAGLALLTGPALLVAPIAFLLKKQLDAAKQIETSEKRIASLKKRLEATKSEAVQERLRKEIAAEQRILAEHEKQAASWTRLKARAKSFMEFISAPLKLPFVDALDEIGDGLERLKKPMRDVVAALGPALAPFTKGIMDGLINFIKALKPALPGIVAGMQAWGKEAPKIGKALGDMIAKIMANPEAVTTAVQSISQALQDLAGLAAIIVVNLTKLGNAFHTLGVNIDALDAGNFGNLTGAFRIFGTVAHQSIILALSALDALFSSLARIPFVGAIFKGAADTIHGALLRAQTDFNQTKDSWIRADNEFKRRKIKAEIKGEIADLEGKIAVAKAKLDTVKNKKTKARIQADIANLELKVALAKAKLTTVAKKLTKAKIQAAINDLEAKVKTAKSRLDSVKNKKTEARIKANIKAAEAEISRLKAQLNNIPDEQVNVHVNPVINFSAASLRRMVLKNSSGESWGGSLAGGADISRTGGPRISVAAPNVDTRVFIDGREIQAAVRSSVTDENSRNAFRARVGSRN